MLAMPASLLPKYWSVNALNREAVVCPVWRGGSSMAVTKRFRVFSASAGRPERRHLQWPFEE